MQTSETSQFFSPKSVLNKSFDPVTKIIHNCAIGQKWARGPQRGHSAQSEPSQLPALTRLSNVPDAARGAAAGIHLFAAWRTVQEIAMPYDRKRYAEDPAYREKTLADRRAHYNANSERINEGRRRRYATDADYRAKVLADNRKTSRAHRLQRSYGISLQHY